VGGFVAATVFTFVAGLHRRHPRLTFTGLALAVLALAMSLKSRRFIPLFGIAQSLVLAPVLSVLLARASGWLRARWPRLQRPVPWSFVLPSLAVLFGLWRLSPYPLSSSAFLYLTAQDGFPVEALNVAEVNHLSGKVFAFYQWGGYVDLRTNGRLQVYIDGRADTVFDDQIYRRYTRVLGMAKGWEDIVDRSGADYFLWPKRHGKQIEGLRETGQWRTLYADHVAALLIRADLPRPEPLLPSPDSPWRELALGWRASAAKNLPEAEQHFAQALAQMPNLRMACEWLANTQARAKRLAEAEATLDRCQRSFPNKARRQELLEIFRQRAEAPP
jgi:tetratricopeptide (TPR) repeat protein